MKTLTKATWLLFFLVLVIAIFFRFYYLNSLPNGLVYDAAVNGNDAWRLLNRGGHTPFLANNGGRESLFIYLQSGAIALFGTTVMALRLPGALLDVIAVGLLFCFSYWLSANRWAAFLTGLMGAVSYWLLVVSRLGLRAVMVPGLSLALFWVLLVAWKNGKWFWFVLAGFTLGLAGYSYSAARILPLIIIMAIIPDLLRPKKNLLLWKRRLLGLLLMVLCAGLTYLPMLVYLLRYPGQFNNRPFSVAIWAFADSPLHLLSLLGDNLGSTARFFCCQGSDISLTFGLPGRPIQDIGMGLLLLLGLILALRKSRQIEWRLLWLWFILGLIPGLLAIESPHPLRLIVSALPAIILVAQAMHFLAERWRFSWHNKLIYPLYSLFTIWIIISGLFTFSDYYLRWAVLPETEAHFSADVVATANNIKARAATGETIEIPQSLYAEPLLHYLLLGPFPPHPGNASASTADFSLAQATEAVVHLNAEEALIFPPEMPESQINDSLNVDIPPISLKAISYQPEISPGEKLPLILHWEALQHPQTNYQIVVQLLDDAGTVVSLNEATEAVGGAYPTSYWRQTEQIADYHSLALKENLPVGRYRLAVAVYDPRTDSRLAISNPIESDAGDTVFIGPLKVPLDQALDDDFTADEFHFVDVADLLGYRLNGNILSVGQPLHLELFWQATAKPGADYTVFVHLLNSEGNLVAGQDSQPLGGQYPTSIWEPGERISDAFRLDTSGLPPGSYQLEVGLYNALTGERIIVTDDENNRALFNTRLEIQ